MTKCFRYAILIIYRVILRKIQGDASKNKNKNMRTIQPGHDVISLFDVSSKTQALTKNPATRGLIASIVGAFLIVAVLGFILNLVQKSLNSAAPAAASSILVSEEPVAYQPGQFVSLQLSRGYIKY